jgi:hypothetical protein
MQDFEKAAEVSTLEIGRTQATSKLIKLSPGNAELVFVARDFDCGHPLDATLEVRVQGTRGTLKQRAVRLNELTWPTSSGRCHPIGYLRLNGASNTRPLRFKIADEDNPITVDIDVTQNSTRAQMLTIWVVYNDRYPVERMLGKSQQEETPRP